MTEEQNNVVEETTPKSFDEMLNEENYQSEFDKRVAKALETAKTKWKEEAEAKQTEAEKLAKMKAEEKMQYELEKSNKERDEALKELNANKLEKQAIEIANDNGVDISLLQLIDFTTVKAEEVEPIIKNFKNVVSTLVEKEVNLKMQEKTPKTVVGTEVKVENKPNSKLNPIFKNYN